jgi:hypothetical protein
MLIARVVLPVVVRRTVRYSGLFAALLILYVTGLVLVAGSNHAGAVGGLFIIGIGVGPLYPLCINRLLGSIENPATASATGLAASATAVGLGPGVLGALAGGVGIGIATTAVVPVLLVLAVITLGQFSTPSAVPTL